MIKICTLGDFDIKLNDISILPHVSSQTRLLRLFKYFITFQSKKLLPDKIIEDLWQETESNDPIGVLRTQISRLRFMFNFQKNNIDPFFEITFIDGYYLFELNNCSVDFLIIEDCMKHQTLEENEDVHIYYNEIIELYKGEFLEELGNDDWVVPVRSRLTRLYTNSLSNYLELLKSNAMDNRVVSICEDVMRYIPYEEIIHQYYIESLVNIGQVRCALNHYSFYTSKMYNDLGVSPSNKIVSIYKKIKLIEENHSSNVVLATLDNELKECRDYAGALICENFYFKFLYNYKNRLKERREEDIFVGIITIDKVGYSQLSNEEMRISMGILLDVISNRLRKSDAITQWNENQMLVLLEVLEERNLGVLIERLKEKFNNIIKNERIILNAKFKKL